MQIFCLSFRLLLKTFGNVIKCLKLSKEANTLSGKSINDNGNDDCQMSSKPIFSRSSWKQMQKLFIQQLSRGSGFLLSQQPTSPLATS